MCAIWANIDFLVPHLVCVYIQKENKELDVISMCATFGLISVCVIFSTGNLL